MGRRYVAFDIETAKDVPGPDFNWRPHRPLGISCAAALLSGAPEPLLWHGIGDDGTPAPRMSRDEVRAMVDRLCELVAEGWTLLTWNGLGFDLDVLAEESGDYGRCRALALGHVDAMFHIFCAKGFPVALEKAAQALHIPGKLEGMSGLLAPQLWAQGRHQEVLDYVAQDVRVTLQVAELCETRRAFEWLTRRGTPGSMPLPRGWLAVKDALALAEPDTSWMDAPLSRREFTAWLDSAGAGT